MKHICTYFDRGFLAQGVALAKSMARWNPQGILWVLALDGEVEDALAALAYSNIKVVPLKEVEQGDSALGAAKSNRSRVEYYFTLSPSWPLWLFDHHPEIDQLFYIDADMFFFFDLDEVLNEIQGHSVFVCGHRFPDFLRHYEKHGIYNVGIVAWRRDDVGLSCLRWWRERCLEWCFDRLEDGKYADQKYLEAWPALFPGVIECSHPGVNLAPWNWLKQSCKVSKDGRLTVDGRPLVLFHFARFRPVAGDWLWQSGQLDYGVMPHRLRNAIYGEYWRALLEAHSDIRKVVPGWKGLGGRIRIGRAFFRELPFRLLFGSDWIRLGRHFYSFRFGLGRYSGRFLSGLRRIFFHR